MKKSYSTPHIRVVSFECGYLLQNSGDSPMRKGSGSADNQLEVLSNRRGGSIWDED